MECSFGYVFDVVWRSCFYTSVSYVLRADDIPYFEWNNKNKKKLEKKEEDTEYDELIS